MADENVDEVKIGAMISTANKQTLTAAHDAIAKLGIGCGAPKSVDIDPGDDGLVSFGGEIKALGDGKVGGYLVRFSTADDPDLTGDYFTKETNLHIPASLPVFYHHGMDAKIGKRVIGQATTRIDEVGAWAETQLNMRDEYDKAIYAMAEAGKLGYSSGALPHLVEREPVKAGVAYIKSWYVGEASLTPTPAEPRNSIVSLKSLIPASGVADADNLPVQSDKEFKMAELDVKAMIDAALAERDAATKAAELKAAEIKSAEEAGYKKAVEELRARGYKSAAFSTQPVGFSEEKDAVPGFVHWIKTGQTNGALIPAGNDWGSSLKAQYNVTTANTGGNLVPDPLYNRIIEKRQTASFVRQAPCQFFTTNSDHILVPTEGTAQTAFVSTAEGVAYNENEATMGQTDLALIKYTKETRATEEFLAGENSNFDSWLIGALARAEALTENTVATTALLAAATAGTAAASQTALTIPELQRLIGELGAGYNVQGETGFIGLNSTKYYCKGLAFASAQPWDFDGQPFYVSDTMPAMTQNLRSVAFGNWNFFGVAERPGMMVQRNPYLYMATGVVGIFANIYRAYAVLQALAFRTMAQAN